MQKATTQMPVPQASGGLGALLYLDATSGAVQREIALASQPVDDWTARRAAEQSCGVLKG